MWVPCSDQRSFRPVRVPVRLAVLVLALSGISGWALPNYLTAKQRATALRGGVLCVPDADALPSRLAPRSGLDRPNTGSGAASGATESSRDELHLETDGRTAAQVARRIRELQPGCPDTTRYRIAQSVARWSRNNGLPWQVVTALIWRESHFNPNAQGSSGEKGLMQLLRGGSYDIDANVRAGCVHLKGCVDTAGGDMRRALGHYNGGGRCVLSYADAILEVANVPPAGTPVPLGVGG